nr:hypothetical protein CFP56_66796 [Quercus suber]
MATSSIDCEEKKYDHTRENNSLEFKESQTRFWHALVLNCHTPAIDTKVNPHDGIRIIHLAEINGKILKLKQRTILLIIG